MEKKTISIEVPDVSKAVKKLPWSIKLLLIIFGLIYAPIFMVAVLAAYGGYMMATKKAEKNQQPIDPFDSMHRDLNR